MSESKKLPWGLRQLLTIGVVVGVSLAIGCQTIRSPFSSWFGTNANDDEAIRRLADTSDIRGPLQRLVDGRKQRKSTSLSPAAGRDEFDAAVRLYKQGQFAESEKRAKRIAKKYKNSPVREDALFLIAESQFEQKKYSWAQDSYDRLVEEFPSTRYLEVRNRRLFNIARYWLQSPDVVTTDNVKLAEFDPSGKRPKVRIKKQPKKRSRFDISRTIPIFPNFWDRTRPVFDTEGRAIQALKSIWQNDPTGALADDALMLTASHYMRNGNYLEADHIYKIIRDEYPKSKHSEHAHVLGSFVKQASYQGPAYDGKVLDEAKELKQSAIRLYPQNPERERLEKDLRKIRLAKAASDWEMVRFYQRKNKPRAVAIYCREILRRFPKTPHADRARKLLQEMGEPLDPRQALRKQQAAPAPKSPRLFPLPKVELPKLPRVPIPKLGFGNTDSAKADDRNRADDGAAGKSRP